ncbi:MAG: hypothetical protein J5548_15815 [Prevotella sp.]|nr:hypothetical protein [Prevotella sp.]
MPFLKNDEQWKPVVTTRQIIQGDDDITCVHLDLEGDWEVLGSDDFTEEDLDVCSVEEVLALDPSLENLPELLPGQTAVRDGKDAPWDVV